MAIPLIFGLTEPCIMSDCPLENQRRYQLPLLPKMLQSLRQIAIEPVSDPRSALDPQIQDYFELSETPQFAQFSNTKKTAKAVGNCRVGIVCSGGQAPGGHNVIAGLFHALEHLCEKSSLIGFLNGPQGIVANQYRILDKSQIEQYLNTGGFDLIGSGRTKIETSEQFERALATCQNHHLDGLVIIGGDDSNTNAALLAKYFKDKQCATKVVGVPKTIDGDLKGGLCEISFGHDTACKLYSELIGNIARDAMSARKYYHFIRLMGRSASHITLECALQTQPTWALIGEEVREKQQTLSQIVQSLCDLIQTREKSQMTHGLFLIPEGLIEFIPEFRALIDELNELQAKAVSPPFVTLSDHLTAQSAALIATLPNALTQQLYLDRDPHGNVQVSRIETERLLADLVEKELKSRAYPGKFNAVTHFFGYEARAGLPTLFDSDYTYALGMTAALLIAHNFSGYLAALSKLSHGVADWQPHGIPLVAMMHMERRGGKMKPVIQKALVDIKGTAFAALEHLRSQDATKDRFVSPGPIQFFGPDEVSRSHILTLDLENASQATLRK